MSGADVGQVVALYGGAGGRGVVIKTSDMSDTRLVRFTDGSEIWCSVKNLGAEREQKKG